MRRSMIYHCYPVKDMDWKANCMAVFNYRHLFDGRIYVTASYGRRCAGVKEVTDFFQQFGPLTLKFVPNNPSKGLNISFRDQVHAMLKEDGIIFKAHTKGISHGPRDDSKYWRESMAELCLGDIEKVEAAFAAGFKTYGPYRTDTRDGQRVVNHTEKRWPGWHYPGAFFWYQSKDVPASFFDSPMHHYENEEFPCIIGPIETGFCPTPNNCDFRNPLPCKANP